MTDTTTPTIDNGAGGNALVPNGAMPPAPTTPTDPSSQVLGQTGVAPSYNYYDPGSIPNYLPSSNINADSLGVNTNPTTYSVPGTFDANNFVTNLKSTLDTATNQTANDQSVYNQALSDVTGLGTEIGGQGQYQVNYENSLGVSDNAKKLQDLNLQINQKVGEFQQATAQVNNDSIFGGFAEGEKGRLNNVAAAQIGALSSIAQTLQGNISYAQSLAQRATDLKYKPLEAELQNKLTVLQANRDNLTADQKRQADIQTEYYQGQLAQVDKAKADHVNAISELGYALRNGAPQDVVTKLASDPNLSTAQVYAQIPGQYIGKDKFSATYPGSVIYNTATGQPVGSVGTGGGTGSGVPNIANPVVQSTMQMIGAKADAPVSLAIQTYGLPAIVQGLIGQEGGSPQGVVNNPGNIKFAGLPGQTDSGVKATDGGTFASYASPQDGQNAVGQLVQNAANSGQNLSDFIAKYKGVSNGAPQSNVTVSGAATNQNFTQDPVYTNLKPADQSTVAGILNYQQPLPSGRLGLYYKQIASQIDPSFDAGKYDRIQKLKTEYQDPTSSAGGAIVAANTAIAHIAELQKAFQQLDNTGSHFYNGVRNAFNAEFNAPALKSVNLATSAVTNELKNVYAGGGGGNLSEYEDWKKGIEANATPAEQKAAIQTALTLLQGKTSALSDQYKAVTGQPYPVFNQNSNVVLAKQALQPGEVLAMDKQGNIGGISQSDFNASPGLYTLIQ